jgi:hypothetical protein
MADAYQGPFSIGESGRNPRARRSHPVGGDFFFELIAVGCLLTDRDSDGPELARQLPTGDQRRSEVRTLCTSSTRPTPFESGDRVMLSKEF